MNYTALQASVAGYLHRTDMTTVIQDCINQARFRIGGDLRSLANHVVGTVTSFSGGLASLPTNYSAMTSVTVDEVPLQWVPPQEWEFNVGNLIHYSIIGDDLAVDGAGSTTVVDITYFAIPAVLSAGADVSFGMNEWPNLWIFAATAEAAVYAHDLDLLATIEAAYQSILATANAAGSRGIYGPSPAMRDMTRNITAAGSGL
jgi:hypothetical protein